MLRVLGLSTMGELLEKVIPPSLLKEELFTFQRCSEEEALVELRGILGKNRLGKSYIGMGFHATYTPIILRRQILENPGWYTAYTPYQPEISQGRLEALALFQQMVIDLTSLEIANASLLDEATAAAEGMAMTVREWRGKRRGFLVDENIHPQTLAVIQTRAEAMEIKVEVSSPSQWEVGEEIAGVLFAYPNSLGAFVDPKEIVAKAQRKGAIVVVTVDPLALTLFAPPGDWGADIAVGSAQRFGVPLGYGGPHPGFIASKKRFQRKMPGRMVGLSRDRDGSPAFRLALQSREQHIRRERATSNICTSQVLLAVLSALTCCWHGPSGIKAIGERIRELTLILKSGLERGGYMVNKGVVFDTVVVTVDDEESLLAKGRAEGIFLRRIGRNLIGITLDETTTLQDVEELAKLFSLPSLSLEDEQEEIPQRLVRETSFLTADAFNTHHSEHGMLRFLKRLERKDVTLAQSMIPLGSCTMKLNPSAAMEPITWKEVGTLHPFVPLEDAEGYAQLISSLGRSLCQITGFDEISFQPNAGSQGELAGLLTIRAYHLSRGDGERTVVLIPASAHGTNPASAVMAGMDVVVIPCDKNGSIDCEVAREKIEENRSRLGALMVTYPSTHGIFEEGIEDLVREVHRAGGQVYWDGANLNAMVGLVCPGDLGMDVGHLNLHKTFAIPHGGGGPGVGPVVVKKHLAPFLPNHPVVPCGGEVPLGTLSSAPFGSAGVLPIPWVYIRMMGSRGLQEATEQAILSANYLMRRLEGIYPVLFKGSQGAVAHEFILDCRGFQKDGITVTDIAKRLMDYGFHAPTISFPVPGTMMIEPTESEPKEMLDRFLEALISIREEIRNVEKGVWPADDNPLVHAPHSEKSFVVERWTHPYSRKTAAFPLPWVGEGKVWPSVARIDEVWGDRNFHCGCDPTDAYSD